MIKDVKRPSTDLHNRAVAILGKISYGLDIIAVDTAVIVQQGPTGPRPTWGIIYYAKGLLIGPDHNVANMTIILDPFITDEDLEEVLHEGCNALRTSKRQQASTQNGHKL